MHKTYNSDVILRLYKLRHAVHNRHFVDNIDLPTPKEEENNRNTIHNKLGGYKKGWERVDISTSPSSCNYE